MRQFPILFLALGLLFFSCNSTEENESTSDENTVEVDTSSTEMMDEELSEMPEESDIDPTPFERDGYTILEMIQGDLDKDGIPETAVAYDTGKPGEFGNTRKIQLFKGNDADGWEEWISSTTAIMESESGGMMGDGFDGLTIEKGILIVYHWGGSRWKWNYTHKYRFQEGDMFLIGATSTGGAPCEYWYDLDYNLSTGDATYSVELDECPDWEADSDYEEKDLSFNDKLDELPRFSTFRVTENFITDSEGDSHSY